MRHTHWSTLYPCNTNYHCQRPLPGSALPSVLVAKVNATSRARFLSRLSGAAPGFVFLQFLSIYLSIYRYCSTEYAAYSLLDEEDAAKLPLEQFKGFVLTSELDNRQTLLQINSFSRFPFKAISDLSAYTNIFDVVKIAKAASDVAKVIIRKLSSLLEPTRTYSTLWGRAGFACFT